MNDTQQPIIDNSMQDKASSAAITGAGYVDLEFISEREGCWNSIENNLVFIGCGDDREPTDASADELEKNSNADRAVMNPQEGYASVYGGLAGEAKNILVVGAAQYGKQFILDMGGFDGVMDLLIKKGRNPQTIHSAVGNENDQRHFCMQGENSIGCAYCGGTGATSGLLTDPDNKLIREVARQDQKFVFGSDKGFDELLQGHLLMLDYATEGKSTAFAFNRPEYRKFIKRYGNNLGMMILSGGHCKAKVSGVISNFSLDEVGNPHKAHQKHLDFYRLDIAVVTRIVLESIREELDKFNYRLSAELLMRAFQLDATPVRAVLVSVDSDPTLHGKLDPRFLRIGTRGNPWESIKTIESMQGK